ncbi:alpha/beta fold hydrolase [Burkholderia sp. S171]|uniref:alpha/beta fold hydrolase n=1 Tax=Burkholderia sp. S171 TaxID=1641860 RepID=UPI00131C3541|nr:alpha/beta fold hydrolase [Burkholderia sp. S171]
MKRETLQSAKHVTSLDGTSIGYQSFGSGSGVVLVEGAMGTAENYRQLAFALADQFTVHVPDRRGRGMSPRPYDAKHSIDDDVEDLRCVLEHTQSRYLFGLSSGAMIVLEGLRQGLRVERAAVYEPPFYLDGMSHDDIQRFNAQVERKQLAAALVTVMGIVRLGPPLVRFVPQWLLRVGAGLALRADSRRSTPYARLSELIPAMRYDLNVVASMNHHLNDLRVVNTPVLLMGGDRSPDYLKTSILTLKKLLPVVELVELVDADYSAPWNDDLNGRPVQVGRALQDFFAPGH